ncbi:MAG: diaminopimelate epimerase, partial [Chloroflexi bacterium]|nr:diaminopimelate epimerase [Chloroflexota bacterium]
MKFTKMQGAGNDYIYIDARELDQDWPSLCRQMSDRHFGIGGDGIILIENSDFADLKMRMYNADGSEGEMCGNGIRCFAKFAIEHQIVDRPEGALTVDTLAGIRQVVPLYRDGIIASARVAMGTPEFDPASVPVNLEKPSGEVRVP